MSTLPLISLLVTTAAVFAWVSRRYLKLPLTIGTMILTLAVSLGLRALSLLEPGLRSWAGTLLHQIDFDRLILHGMLSLLLFAGAFMMDLERLWRERVLVATFAIFGTVLSTGLMAVVMHFGLGLLGVHAGWQPVLLFGALISPTDPIAVLEMLRRVGVSRSLQAQLAGESLFNDGVGAVLFLAVLETGADLKFSIAHVATRLTLEVGGAFLLAVAAAWVASRLMQSVQAHEVDILLTLALALGGYALAEALHVSAPLEAVIAAIALRRFNHKQDPQWIAHDRIDSFWETLDEVQNSVLFVLLGLEVLAVALDRYTLAAGVVAILAVLAVRTGVIALLLKFLRLFKETRSSVAVLSWGGLHGGLSLALALSVPAADAPGWFLPATYLVVAFSIIVQGGSMPLLLRNFRSVTPSETSEAL